jgi:hypothetical protein
MKPALLFVVVLLCGCASSPAPKSQDIAEMSFPIAGGKILHLPVTDRGPIPAENDKIKIQIAGFAISPSTGDPAIPSLTWAFAFKTKTDQRIEQVVVEEVGESDSAKLLVSDDRPDVEHGGWAGKSEVIKADKQSAAWLYSSKPSIFVFKFSIKVQGMPAQILYQPSWFTAAAKKAMIAGYGEVTGS